MKENIVAINIFTGDKLQNSKGFPILYYWDKDTDIITDLKNNTELYSWLEDRKIFEEIETYFDTKLNIVTYYSGDFSTQTINLNTIYGFSKDVGNLFNNVATEILRNLYYKVHNEHITVEQQINLRKAFTELYEYTLTFVTKETYTLYIKGYLQENYSCLNQENINKITEYIMNL